MAVETYVSAFVFSYLFILILLISESFSHPVKELTKTEISVGKIQETEEQKESPFNGPMMIPEVSSFQSLDTGHSGFTEKLKNFTFEALNANAFLYLRDDNAYINNVNESEMGNLSRNRYGNLSVQNSSFENEESREQYDLMSRSIRNYVETSFYDFLISPVAFFAIIGAVAVIIATILWLKNQMIQSEKSKKVVVLGGNQIQLSNSTCSCPNPGLPSEERGWICHTLINLNNKASSALPAQPQEAIGSPNIPVNRTEEVERKPEIRIKAKSLLERRGSSASLTIDLPQGSYDNKPHVVTPTRECMSEEFPLSAGNVLSRLQLKSCLDNVQRLNQEFCKIPLNHQEKSVVTGCGPKNRYPGIFPNEETRVKLTSSDDHALDAYINANYIRGYDGEEKAYIATQGPLPHTVQDLYKMAWNERSPIIVMITTLDEMAKVKCESYFPTEANTTATYGDFRVTVISVVRKEGFSVRELEVQNDREKRKMLHYWCDSWPDHKTPQDAGTIVAMATEIERCKGSFRNMSLNNNESQSGSYGPVIVHCSAGIGRTGCFIAISLAICQLMEKDQVDILGIVCQMRCDRGGMIQTPEQYVFVHKAIVAFEDSLSKARIE